MDQLKFAEMIVSKIKGYFDIALDSVSVKIEEMGKSAREYADTKYLEIPLPENGKDGVNGKSAYEVAVSLGFQGDVYQWLDSMKGKDGEQGEKGQDGTDGKDGQDGAQGVKGDAGLQGEKGEKGDSVTVDDVLPALEPQVMAYMEAIEKKYEAKFTEMRDAHAAEISDLRTKANQQVAEAIAAIPEPQHGKDGAPGPKGEDGKSVTLDDVIPIVKEAVAQIPAPKDGVDGKDGESITVEDVLPALESMQAKWALDWERNANGLLTKAIEAMPKPKDGEDGKDGLGFEEIELVQIDERNYVFRITNGERTKEYPIYIPAIIYREVYNQNEKYMKGDTFTYAGSTWITKVDNPEGRPGSSKDFQLIVKKGRDGK